MLLAHPGQNPPRQLTSASRSRWGITRPDRQAVAVYRRRLYEIHAEIDDADADVDLGRAERLRLEKEALTAELTSLAGPRRMDPQFLRID